ncbi:MarR family winged helix-turn-helix transcriptional regulator [Desulfosporosinus youngiae]|nr:MarR family winged helix-turn-helix transcriptional regulator [Desulfosporosinus youngiae]
MNKVRSIKQKIGYDILNLAMTYVELDKKTRYYGTDVPIFHSEIHMISVIAEYPGVHVGGLAEILGITKGSVSEIIKKLERKALVVKEIDVQNLSKLALRLTEKGEKAHSNHMRYHTILNSMVEEELETVSEHDVKFLSCFLSAIKAKVEKFNESVEG